MDINCLSRPENEIHVSVGYMIARVASFNPDKHVFCIFRMFSDADIRSSSAPDTWRRTIEELLKKKISPFVHYINGLELLGGAHRLSGDLTHPSPRVVREISKNLIKKISNFIR